MAYLNPYVPPPNARARRVSDSGGRRRRRGVPTSCLPRTEERIAEYERRASLGQEIFHPEDATIGESQALRIVLRERLDELGRRVGNFSPRVDGVIEERPESEPLSRSFGDRLRQVRQKRSLSVKQVALKAGVSITHVRRLEWGDRQPSLSVLVALAAVLTDGSLDALLGLSAA